MIYTKEEFKRIWDSNDCSLTFTDIADCAKAWGLYSKPKCAHILEVRYRVCEAAGVTDMPEKPFKRERRTITEDFAWQVYNIVDRWKNGAFGKIPLQKVLDEEI